MTLFSRRSRAKYSATSSHASPRSARRRPSHPRPHARPGRSAYVLVVDESGSTSSSFRMASGRSTTRMGAIRLAAEQYLHQLAASNPRQLAAVVGFTDSARLCHPMAPVGPALGSLSRAIRTLHPQGITNLTAGLSLALGQLARARVRRGNLVVITDGAANKDTSRIPDMIRRIRSTRTRVFTIGVGNNADSDYDRQLLVNLARLSGGRFASAHSFTALCSALRRAV